MTYKSEKTGTVKRIVEYLRHLPEQTPFWRCQALGWGLILVVAVFGGALFAFLGLSGVYGGGSISYSAAGSPGPVTFRHYSHMTFQDGKYKDCKSCHDKLFAAQKYGTYVIRALRDSPERKIRIGKETSTLYVPLAGAEDENSLITYEVPRACATCATGSCHDGKESFSRLECLMCHQGR
jgi:hypothetical protein